MKDTIHRNTTVETKLVLSRQIHELPSGALLQCKESPHAGQNTSEPLGLLEEQLHLQIRFQKDLFPKYSSSQNRLASFRPLLSLGSSPAVPDVSEQAQAVLKGHFLCSPTPHHSRDGTR